MKTNFAIVIAVAALTGGASASAAEVHNAMIYQKSALNFLDASIRSDDSHDSAPMTDRGYAEQAYQKMVKQHMDPLTNPGSGIYDAGDNIDNENDPGPQKDDRYPPGDERDPNDGSNIDVGGPTDQGGFADEGHGRNPAPKPDFAMRAADVINIRPDLFNVRSLSQSGTGIGG